MRTPLSIAYGEIATHNHFVLDAGGKVFNRTAPVIKLPAGADEAAHLRLLGPLNSSVGCFWLKQVCHNKGSTVDQRGARQRTSPFEDFYVFNATNLERFPLPEALPLEPARQLHTLGRTLGRQSPAEWLKTEPLPTAAAAAVQQGEWERTRERMIALQEELDWQAYRLYGLLEEDLTCGEEPPPLRLGERAFEIVLARAVAAGEHPTTWFARHGSTPRVELPAEWPDGYRRLVERRIAAIERDPSIALIEQPEYKRRWNTEPWEAQLHRALRERLLARLESYFDLDGRMSDAGTPTARFPVALVSTAQLADVAAGDAEFRCVAALYRGDPAFQVQKLVDELVQEESVPLLPVLRYRETGLRKRAEWEAVWEQQRGEDRLDARTQLPRDDPRFLTEREAAALKRAEVGEIPVPPKYASSDFQATHYWRLRGKLDVPKERWVLFPHCEGPDGTPRLAWAGYDSLQLAQAISNYYVEVQERLGGGSDPRLTPLLAALLEVLPWLKQWHNEIHPEFGVGMGDYFEGFIQEEARRLEKTLEEIRAWRPPARPGKTRAASRSRSGAQDG